MLTTNYDGGTVKITMDDSLKKELTQQSVNPEEVYRLIESFAGKLLSSEYTGDFFLENEDTGARLKLHLGWEAEKEGLIKIVEVNLKNVKAENVSNVPNGAKFDFSAPTAQ